MMTEISLNVLDVAQNSIKAKATLIEITVVANNSKDTLEIVIKDNGYGMTKEQLKSVTDPFFTTRTTRKIGLGIPFFKQACELTNGSFSISSEKNIGTTVNAVFVLSSINRMPLGDMTETIHALITLNKDIDFVYQYQLDERAFILDTRQFREVLDGVEFNVPEVSSYIKEYLRENKKEVDLTQAL